jgi:aminomethyltransferase
MSATGPTAPAPPTPAKLARTALYDFHRAHGAHMFPFAGWEMPRDYGGVIPEHLAVRRDAGLFDVSHMGILTVRGASAPALLARRTTADVGRLSPGQVRYTFLLNLEGQIIDDLLITRLDQGGEDAPSFLVVPNAATAARVFDLLRQHRRPDTAIARHNGRVAILAVQGPRALAAVRSALGWALDDLPSYHARWVPDPPAATPPSPAPSGVDLEPELARWAIASRTGYTGEAGVELFVRAERAPAHAEALVAAGVRPVGLVARDSLRLEKGYLLSGQDFHEDRTPLEAGQERFVDFEHAYVGRDRLLQQRKEGPAVRLAGLSVSAPDAIPRHGTPVRANGGVVATVTSGGPSPSLQHGIALAYLPVALTALGTSVELELRGRAVPAEVVKLPFLAAPKKAG